MTTMLRWAPLAAAFLSACGDQSPPPRPVAGADPARGLEVVERVGCAACHAIPGVEWPEGRAGPSLKGFGASPMIAGRFPNQPDVLTAWLVDAPALSPETGMPPMPISEAEARDVAAWLYTLDDR
ncbi:c-type cytochrome [Brevundimonas sp.]|uniref:c-type cytochrome n=1 Tax=Brevundimonas sp. TaxID=1871086 RepID=UPI002D21F43A|nr:c-type cytochrome [Brevundimonas sp.]HYD28063.1 c-type cytochrome [Brevundimonas sp.]